MSVADGFYEELTDMIVAAMKEGTGDFVLPWNKTNVMSIPKNVTTDVSYQGSNVLKLWMAGIKNNYRSQEWATFNQWNDLGCKIKKGERGVTCIKYVNTAKKDEQDGETTIDENGKPRRMRPWVFKVFNADQVEGYEPKIPAVQNALSAGERNEHAETFFKNLGADIRHGGNRAYYHTVQDYIQIPNFEQFHSPAKYYATLAHEATHWTAPKNRVDRNTGDNSDKKEYAFEELVAELGAAFTMGNLGLPNSEMRDDHAAYLAIWIKNLEEDPRVIYRASKEAQKAANYLLSLQQPGMNLRRVNANSMLVKVFQPIALDSGDWDGATKITNIFGDDAPVVTPETEKALIAAVSSTTWEDVFQAAAVQNKKPQQPSRGV